MSVGDNIVFDPNKEELAVADVVLAVSVSEMPRELSESEEGSMDVDSKPLRKLTLRSIRTIDPPSRLTPPGLPNFLNTATGGVAPTSLEQEVTQRESGQTEGVWQAPRGGAKRKMIAAMIGKVMEKGGVAEEVLDGLDAVHLG